MYNVFDLYCDTDSFNRVAGNYDNPDFKSLNNQLELIKEEFNELIKGHNEGDLEEIVDGCADVAVTLFGYMRKLECLYGIDFSDIMQAVGENNLSKFPTEATVAAETSAYYDLEKGIPTSVTYNSDYKCYVIRNAETGKILKPLGFTAVDLKPFLPKEH